MEPADEVRQLRDAALLWVIDGEFGRVVDAAVECLMQGTSTPSLDTLAGSLWFPPKRRGFLYAASRAGAADSS